VAAIPQINLREEKEKYVITYFENSAVQADAPNSKGKSTTFLKDGSLVIPLEIQKVQTIAMEWVISSSCQYTIAATSLQTVWNPIEMAFSQIEISGVTRVDLRMRSAPENPLTYAFPFNSASRSVEWTNIIVHARTPEMFLFDPSAAGVLPSALNHYISATINLHCIKRL